MGCPLTYSLPGEATKTQNPLPKYRKLERVAAAIRLALYKDYCHLSERDMSREMLGHRKSIPVGSGARHVVQLSHLAGLRTGCRAVQGSRGGRGAMNHTARSLGSERKREAIWRAEYRASVRCPSIVSQACSAAVNVFKGRADDLNGAPVVMDRAPRSQRDAGASAAGDLRTRLLRVFYPYANCQNKGPGNPYTDPNFPRGPGQYAGAWSGGETVDVAPRRTRTHRPPQTTFGPSGK